MTAIAVLVCVTASAQEKVFPIVYYNVENFFDTVRDTTINDVDFTPDGQKKWNDAKYAKKLNNLQRVFYSIAQAAHTFPTIIGISEVENRKVVDDIASTEKLLPANYQIVHYDSPDRRGIDVALLYRPDQFHFIESKAFPVKVEDMPDFHTRDVLMVMGEIENERFAFFVNHWPSRGGGQERSEPLRCRAAEVARHAIDSIQNVYPDIKIVLMGDLNDDPINKSVHDVLGATGKIKEVKENGLFNPMWQMLKDGYGTLGYRDKWNIFDNMVVNENLLNNGTIRLKKSGKYYAHIFNKSFLVQKKGQFKNYPFRTFSGNNFQGGFSDHFPVYLLLTKQD